MTKKDFELIAHTIDSLTLSHFDRKVIAWDFAAALATTNPRFNKQKFIAAATKRVTV